MPTVFITGLQQDKSTGILPILTFDLDCNGLDCWIFFSRDRKAESLLYMGPVTAGNENNHEDVYISQRRERDINETLCRKLGKKLCMNITFAMYTGTKMGTPLPAITNNIEVLIYFYFLKLPLISPQDLFGA